MFFVITGALLCTLGVVFFGVAVLAIGLGYGVVGGLFLMAIAVGFVWTGSGVLVEHERGMR